MQRILVIDDDPQVCDLIRLALETAGYEVEVRKNGIEGQHVLLEHSINLIITDVVMPEKDGLQLIRELRKLEPRPKIIAISGGLTRVNYDPLPAAKLMGAEEILRKPFTVATLLETVKRMLDETPQ